MITVLSSNGSREKVRSDPKFSERVLGSLWLWIEGRLLTQVVDSDVHLKAICRLRVGAHHHPCIVDENVEVLFLCRKRRQPWLSQLRNRPHNPGLGLHGRGMKAGGKTPLFAPYPLLLFCIGFIVRLFLYFVIVCCCCCCCCCKTRADLTHFYTAKFYFPPQNSMSVLSKSSLLVVLGKCSTHQKDFQAEWKDTDAHRKRMLHKHQ